jgi:hypothetical protein
MPLPHKIVLTLIVLIVGALIAAREFAAESAGLGWMIIANVAVMTLGLWVFPEAGGGKPKR